MKKTLQMNSLRKSVSVIIWGICSVAILNSQPSVEKKAVTTDVKDITRSMPVYGHWKNFTTKDGLPSDHAYCVRIDGKRVLVGTHEGMAVYEDGKWTTYTTKDGLAHNGVVSIDISPVSGDVWIGTLGGLSRWSGGKFETFNQLNSGLPNDLVLQYLSP